MKMSDWGVRRPKPGIESSTSGPSFPNQTSASTATYQPSDLNSQQEDKAEWEQNHQLFSDNGPTPISDENESTTSHSSESEFDARPRPESDIAIVTDYLFNAGLFHNAFLKWEHALQEVNNSLQTLIPHTLFAYLGTVPVSETESETQQSLLPGACGECSHEKLTDYYPVLSREIQKYREMIQLFHYPILQQHFLYSLRTLVCGWRLPERQITSTLEHLYTILKAPSSSQSSSTRTDVIRNCLRWCHQILSTAARSTLEDEEMTGILLNTNRSQAIWISSVDIFCLLWDEWQDNPIENAWMIKYELMGLSAANLLRVLTSLMIDAIPHDIFAHIQQQDSSVGRLILRHTASERAQWLLESNGDRLYQHFKRQVLCPGPFKCWSTRDADVEKRRRLQRYIGKVLLRRFPKMGDLKEEESYLWECTCYIPQQDQIDQDPTPSARSVGESTAEMLNECKRIRTRKSSPITCSTPRMDLGSQGSDPWNKPEELQSKSGTDYMMSE